MTDYEGLNLVENSSEGRNYIPFIGRMTHYKKIRICFIFLAVLSVAFFLGFVVMLSEHARSDEQKCQGTYYVA